MTEQATIRVQSLCIAALAVEWVFFGSLHFTFHDATVAQIPDWIPVRYHSFIAVSTGMIEVATGILILYPRYRRWAAYASLALLILFLPSIYKLLAYDSAMPGFGEAARNVARVLLVPNHVLLALCAIHLLQSDTRQLGPARVFETMLGPGQSTNQLRPPVRSGTAIFTVAFIMLMANLAGFSMIQTAPRMWDRSTANLWAMMCLATGALVGFLFAVPRVTLEGTSQATHRPNSNIEVVSDWLTKIIVGVGLVQFHKLGGFLVTISEELGGSLSAADRTRAASFGKALIVYFFIAGALQGYLLTRMYLSARFADDESRRLQGGATTGQAQ